MTAKLPPHKAVLERLIAYRLAMLEQLGVPVRNGRRADVESIAAFAPRLLFSLQAQTGYATD
ncbi:MAG: hypothetical protein ACLS7Z_06730 [Christensenellales bacterium]